MIGGKGEIAILSATSQATNQNLWIDYMKKELTDPKYKDVKLVKVAYGDDLRDKSVSEAEGLLAVLSRTSSASSPRRPSASPPRARCSPTRASRARSS